MDTNYSADTFNAVDFSKIKVGIRTLEDAIYDLSSFNKMLVTKKEWNEHGKNIINLKTR